MPIKQVRLDQDIYEYFRDKAQSEHRTIGAQINLELKHVMLHDIEVVQGAEQA